MVFDITNKYCLLIENLVLLESVYSVYEYIQKYKKFYMIMKKEYFHIMKKTKKN